jgi:hypothetical protein
MDASSRHLAVDDVTADAPPSQDAEVGPVCPEANVSAKLTDALEHDLRRIAVTDVTARTAKLREPGSTP